MLDYREILMIDSLEYNNTEIAYCVHSSRRTVQNVLKVANKMEISWSLDDVTNQALQDLMYTDRY